MSFKTIVILNNIRSNENVGSIFRTSDAAGVSKIILSGYTPAPIDKFGRKNRALSKAALGAEEFVEWEQAKGLKGKIEDLKKENFKVIAVEQHEKSVDYKKFNLELKASSLELAFVFGNEVTGLSKKELSLCDAIIEIPMKGQKESLNVAVAAGIVLFGLNQ